MVCGSEGLGFAHWGAHASHCCASFPRAVTLLLSPSAALPRCSVVGMGIPAGFIQKPPKPELACSKNSQTSQHV